MKKFLKITFIVILIISIKLSLSFFINEIIIINYNKEIYNTTLIKSLYLFNFHKPYIAYYNAGNLSYKNNDFDIAIEKYNKALKKNPPQKHICDIRINLSLALLKEIDTTSSNTVLEDLGNARNNLYNNNCASPIDESGYSKEAENLEEEIKKLEEEMQNSSSDNSSSNNDKKDDNKEKNDSDIEKELKELEKKANSSRQDDLSSYENMDKYEYYSGKKW